jgi:hypothetical protein
MDHLGALIHAKCIDAEIPLVAILGLVHVRIAGLLFKVELGAWMMVASTIVPLESRKPLASRYS